MVKSNVLLIIAILFAFIGPSSLVAETLKIGYEPYPPYVGELNKKPEGYVTEIVKEVFKDHTLELQKMPYVRAIKNLQDGKIDICMLAAEIDLPDQTKVLFPKEEIGVFLMSFFVEQNSNWKYNGLNSLESLKLGLVKGYDYPEFDSVIDKSKFDYIPGVNTTERSLKKLLMGRLTAFYEDRSVVRYTAKKLKLDGEIKEAGTAIEPLPSYIVFNRKIPNAQKLADEFDRKIRLMRESKQLEKILEKYNLKDWK